MKTDLWITLISVLLFALLLNWIPLWRRRSVWFGVTVAPGFPVSPQGRAALRRYRMEIWALSLIAFPLILLGERLAEPWMLIPGIMLQAVGSTAAFGLARNRVLPHAAPVSSVRSASLASSREGLPGGVASVVVPFSMLAAAAVYLHANWQRIPERFPMHWGASGAPDAWGSRAWQSVYTPLLLGVPVIVLLLLLGWGILKASPRARVAATADWTTRFRRANLRLLVAITWGIGLMFAAISLSPLRTVNGGMPLPIWIALALLLIVIAGFGWPVIRVSQEPGSGSDGTPDECWKLGQFYFNPNDPAVVVERRFGVGYTVNFGNRMAWLFIGPLVLIVLAVVLV